MNKNLTWLKPSGEWGIEGVDLAALPTAAYGAMAKLMRLEHPIGGQNPPLTMEDGMSEWISVKDRMPEVGQRVVIVCNKKYSGLFDVLCYYPDYKPWKTDGVAYWMPLPEPPEEGTT